MPSTDTPSIPPRPNGQSQPPAHQAQSKPQPQSRAHAQAQQQAPPGQKIATALPSDFEAPFPSLTRSSTLPTSLRSAASAAMAAKAAAASAAAVRRADPYHLAPEDAFYSSISPPWDRNAAKNSGNSATNNGSNSVSGSELHDARAARQTLRPGVGGSNGNLRRSASGALLAAGGTDSRSRSRRRRRRTWKKLLWVKQSYPDNYTDQATFLENLQRNPRLQPYDFWPLVADSTVIVQHVCSVIIFVICFVGIFQDRVSPVFVVGWGTIATCAGWLVWEWWAGQEQTRPDEDEDGFDGLDDGRFSQQGSGGARRYQREPSTGGSAGIDPLPPSAQRPSSRQGAICSASTDTNISRRSKPTNAAGDALSPLLTPSTESSATGLLNTDTGSRHSRKRSSGRINVHSRSDSNSNGNGNGNGITNANAGINSGVGTSAATSRTTSSTNLWQPSLQVGSGSTINGATGTVNRPPSSHGRSAASEHPPTTPATPRYPPPRRSLTPLRGGRTHHRIATIKSAILIYFTLLGLSPILKSLTRSTSSDSIWAMSFWLLAINIFFFDYSGVWVGAHKFPVASLSTNAALMASTVLASRLPSTGQVFSLTLFSIEVFGLFPVFRRYARHRSWQYHVGLTMLLILGAGAGVGIILTGPGDGLPWRSALAGMVVACVLAAIAMGGCSWWLIGLQKYKNEIYGPWDPARPVIISRRHWNDV